MTSRQSIPGRLVEAAGLFLSGLLIGQTEAKGGGGKRTFGSPKGNSQNQNLGNCSDPSTCLTELSDSTSSILGTTLALVGPLFVLLALIAIIKLCLTNAYPEGHHLKYKQQRRSPLRNGTTKGNGAGAVGSCSHHHQQQQQPPLPITIRIDCCDQVEGGQAGV